MIGATRFTAFHDDSQVRFHTAPHLLDDTRAIDPAEPLSYRTVPAVPRFAPGG
jgi:hypothetical protein